MFVQPLSRSSQQSGDFAYEESVQPGPGQVYSSSLLVGDEILYLGRDRKAVIVKAGPKFEVVGSAKLENSRGVFNASPATVDGRLLIRSNKFFCCIGEK